MCSMQQWRHNFVDLGLIWMEVLGKQISRWVLSSVSRDKVKMAKTQQCVLVHEAYIELVYVTERW